MSDYEFVTVQNFTSGKLTAHTDDGQLVEVGPRGSTSAVRDMTVEEYKALLDEHGEAKVGLVERGGNSISKFVAPKVNKVWVANMTGNPDAPDTVVGYRVNGNGVSEYGHQEPNPNKEARTIYIQGVGRYDEDHIDPMSGVYLKKTWPGREVTLEPYTQIEVSAPEANAFMASDFSMPDSHRGAVVVSEDISNLFHPEISWDLDTRRAYLEMLPEDGENFPAGRKVLGPSEAEIRAQGAEAGLSPREIAQNLDKAKQDCWKRIVLRLFRPNIKKPTQKQFEQAVAKKLPGAKVKSKKTAPAAESAVSDLISDL